LRWPSTLHHRMPLTSFSASANNPSSRGHEMVILTASNEAEIDAAFAP
jgi:hypothetical protein